MHGFELLRCYRILHGERAFLRKKLGFSTSNRVMDSFAQLCHEYALLQELRSQLELECTELDFSIIARKHFLLLMQATSNVRQMFQEWQHELTPFYFSRKVWNLDMQGGNEIDINADEDFDLALDIVVPGCVVTIEDFGLQAPPIDGPLLIKVQAVIASAANHRDYLNMKLRELATLNEQIKEFMTELEFEISWVLQYVEEVANINSDKSKTLDLLKYEEKRFKSNNVYGTKVRAPDHLVHKIY